MEKLKEKYGKLTIKQLEGRALKLQGDIVEGRRKFIEILAYIELMRLWRKNPMHKNSSFEVYLADIFNMRMGTYRREKTAFINYPDEVKKYGVGIVARIHKDCTAVKAKSVLKELDEKTGELKTPIKRDQIETIILKHTPPKKEKSSLSKSYWEKRAMMAEKYLRTERTHNKEIQEQLERQKSFMEKASQAVKELAVARARIKELEEQFERQRPMLESYLAVKSSFKDSPEKRKLIS